MMAVKLASLQRFTDLVPDDGAETCRATAAGRNGTRPSPLTSAMTGIEIFEHDVLLRRAVSARRAVSLSHDLARGVANHVQEGPQIRFLPVAGDRHVRRDEVHHDAELRSDRRLCDGVRKPAAEGVDVALVAGGLDRARNGRAVDADEQVCMRVLASCPPTSRPRTGFRPAARSSRTRRPPTTWHTRCPG